MKDPGQMDGVTISTRLGKREQVHCVECRDGSLDVTPAWNHSSGPQLELPASSTLG